MNTSFDISRDKSLLWLMAIVCGLCAGANYYCQPLISSIQQSFQAPEEQVALTVTFAQVSYALGLLFIVPLGDMLNKAKLIPFLMFGASAGYHYYGTLFCRSTSADSSGYDGSQT